MLYMCMHTLSLADMCHTIRLSAALLLVLRETSEEAKKQGKNGMSTLWWCNSTEQHGHDQLFIEVDTPCAEFACLMVAGSACCSLWRQSFPYRKYGFDDIHSLTVVENGAIRL
jgi:hypothetical protein